MLATDELLAAGRVGLGGLYNKNISSRVVAVSAAAISSHLSSGCSPPVYNGTSIWALVKDNGGGGGYKYVEKCFIYAHQFSFSFRSSHHFDLGVEGVERTCEERGFAFRDRSSRPAHRFTAKRCSE